MVLVIKDVTISSWEEAEPTCISELYVTSLNCKLPSGSFIVINGEDTCGSSSIVGRIMGTTSTDNVSLHDKALVNVFLPLHCCNQEKYWGDGSRRPKRQTERNIHNIPELFQTNEVASISSSDVDDIAFVFRPQIILEASFHAQGMANLFLLRHRAGGDMIPNEHCRPFHSSYGIIGSPNCIECYHAIAWNSIKRIRLELFRPLLRRAQTQGDVVRCYDKMYASPLFIEYLKHRVDQILVNELTDSKAKRRKVEAGVAVRTIVEKLTHRSLIRFETHDDMELLCKLFGETSIVAPRIKFPRVGESPVRLRENSVLNVFAPEEDRQFPFAEKTNRCGIDFILCGDQINCRLRFVRFIYHEDHSVDPVAVCDCPTPMLEDVIRMASDSTLEPPISTAEVSVGDTLIHEGALYDVVRFLYSGNVLCERRSRPELTVELMREDVLSGRSALLQE